VEAADAHVGTATSGGLLRRRKFLRGKMSHRKFSLRGEIAAARDLPPGTYKNSDIPAKIPEVWSLLLLNPRSFVATSFSCRRPKSRRQRKEVVTKKNTTLQNGR
jgi:hypothetical protein